MAGMEILFSCIKNQFQCEEDAIVCCLHWSVISSDFQCIGVGDVISEDESSCSATEMLPAGWNASHGVYTLQYCPKDSANNVNAKHLLKVVKMDSSLLVHFMRVKDEKVALMTFETSEYFGGDLNSFSGCYKNMEKLQQRIKNDLLDGFKKSTKTSSTQASVGNSSRSRSPDRGQGHRGQPSRDDDPLRIGPPRYPQRAPPSHHQWHDPDDPLRSLGRGDLDPGFGIGGGGGGMIFDPLRSGGVPDMDPNVGGPGRLPRGAVPPGARFDPFGPPDIDRGGNIGPRGGRRPGPDPDHLPMPGYDDMFM